MNIEKQLEQMNHMPEDEQLKGKIRRNLERSPQKPLKMGGSMWKEIGIIAAICCIGLFLFITSTMTDTNQATSTDVEAVYLYNNDYEKGFRARASSLYIGVHDVTNENFIRFFERLDDVELLENKKIDRSHYDIVVVKNGEQNRYQLTYDYLWDMDNDRFYNMKNHYSTIITDSVTSNLYNSMGGYYMFVPIALLFISISASFFYKRRKLQEPRKLKGRGLIIAIMMSATGLFLAYYINIGPIYKPLLFVCAFIYGYILWWPVGRNVTNMHIRKIEKWRSVGITIAVIFWIYII